MIARRIFIAIKLHYEVYGFFYACNLFFSTILLNFSDVWIILRRNLSIQMQTIRYLSRISIVIFIGLLCLGSPVYADEMDDAVSAANEASTAAQPEINARREESLQEMSGNEPSTKPSARPSQSASSPLSSTSFMFDTGKINPSSNPDAFSRQGSTQNVKNLLKTIAETLLVIVATGSVLFIVIGGFFMVTSAGDTEKANRGKIIITYNLMALALAMLSYGIMRLVVWII